MTKPINELLKLAKQAQSTKKQYKRRNEKYVPVLVELRKRGFTWPEIVEWMETNAGVKKSHQLWCAIHKTYYAPSC